MLTIFNLFKLTLTEITYVLCVIMLYFQLDYLKYILNNKKESMAKLIIATFNTTHLVIILILKYKRELDVMTYMLFLFTSGLVHAVLSYKRGEKRNAGISVVISLIVIIILAEIKF